MSQQPAPSVEQRTKDVMKVGGSAAVVIGVLTAGSADAGAMVLLNAFAGGSMPKLDVEGAELIANTWVYTAPLAITVGLLVIAYLRFGLGNDSGQVQLVAIAGAVVAGFVLGNLVYGAVYDSQLVLNLQSLTQAVGSHPGGWQQRVGYGIAWFVEGYAEFFGWPYFFAAVVAGGFASWAGLHLLAPSADPS